MVPNIYLKMQTRKYKIVTRRCEPSVLCKITVFFINSLILLVIVQQIQCVSEDVKSVIENFNNFIVGKYFILSIIYNG